MKNKIHIFAAKIFVIAYFLLTALLIFTRHTDLANLKTFAIADHAQDYMSGLMPIVLMWLGFAVKDNEHKQ